MREEQSQSFAYNRPSDEQSIFFGPKDDPVKREEWIPSPFAVSNPRTIPPSPVFFQERCSARSEAADWKADFIWQ